MKGNPAGPGGQLTSKPTWFGTFWVSNRVGFFLFPAVREDPNDRERRRSRRYRKRPDWSRFSPDLASVDRGGKRGLGPIVVAFRVWNHRPSAAEVRTEEAAVTMVPVKGNAAEFRFFRPQARQVCIVGDFNNWRLKQLQMQRDEGGYWTSRLRLPPGAFKFRYWADGEWFTDFAAFGVEYGPFGFDSIVRIPSGSG